MNAIRQTNSVHHIQQILSEPHDEIGNRNADNHGHNRPNKSLTNERERLSSRLDRLGCKERDGSSRKKRQDHRRVRLHSIQEGIRRNDVEKNVGTGGDHTVGNRKGEEERRREEGGKRDVEGGSMDTLPCEQKEEEEGWVEGRSQTHYHDEQTRMHTPQNTDTHVITKKNNV